MAAPLSAHSARPEPPPAPNALPAVDEIYRRYAAPMWRTLRSLGVREADLEDACQEVFIVAHRRRDSFDGSAQVSTWLYGIALRVAAGWRRKAHVRRELLVEPAYEPEAAGPSAQHDAARTLAQLLEGVDPEKREVFVLFEVEQLPMAEVATALGVPLKTAYSRLYAARKDVEAAVRRVQAQEAR